jgi:uncharacterized protein (TIGR02145 family)
MQNKINIFFIPFAIIVLVIIFISSCGNTKKENNNTNNDTVISNPPKKTPIVVIRNNDSVSDIDGNYYHTVTIGNQTWMAENLKVTKYANGDKISNICDYDQWSDLKSGAYCEYNNKVSNAHIYGRLYNWFAVSDKRNIAPNGWRVANESDWKTLINYLAGEMVAGGKMKETGEAHWKFPNSYATNESGFTALPGGIRSSNGEFGSFGKASTWWANTVSDETKAIGYFLNYSDGKVDRNDNDKTFGLSVRCIKE